MNNWIKKQEIASKLPLGHYGIKEAKDAIEQEYGACHNQAIVLGKKFKIARYTRIDPIEAFDLCCKICDMVGLKHINAIVINSKDVNQFASAHYNSSKRRIHFKNDYVYIDVLLHELSHHFAGVGAGHGPLFMEMQELVYEIAKKVLIEK